MTTTIIPELRKPQRLFVSLSEGLNKWPRVWGDYFPPKNIPFKFESATVKLLVQEDDFIWPLSV